MKTQPLEKLDIKHKEIQQVELNTGISKEKRQRISKGLSKLLADSYSLMLKVQNYHWNVRGKNFRSLHLITEEQYEEIFPAIDDIAERIRALGFISPGSFNDFKELTVIDEPDSSLSDDEMTADLLNGHEKVAQTARNVLGAASEAKDEATVDLLTDRLDKHEKAAWMLRSMLEQ